MEFVQNGEHAKMIESLSNDIKKVNQKISKKETELISLKSELTQYQKRKFDLERKEYERQKELKRKEEIEKEKENLKKSVELKNDNIELKIVDVHDTIDEYIEIDDITSLDDLVDGDKIANFGDIIDPTGHRHYSWTFVGEDNKLINSTRSEAIDQEFGVTVPYDICKYFPDSVSKYKNIKDCIVAYELPYLDATVQKYKVKKNHLYEYVHDFDSDEWYLEQISLKDQTRTRPALKK